MKKWKVTGDAGDYVCPVCEEVHKIPRGSILELVDASDENELEFNLTVNATTMVYVFDRLDWAFVQDAVEVVK